MTLKNKNERAWNTIVMISVIRIKCDIVYAVRAYSTDTWARATDSGAKASLPFIGKCYTIIRGWEN